MAPVYNGSELSRGDEMMVGQERRLALRLTRDAAATRAGTLSPGRGRA
jgi:hypothetical protein